MLLLLAGAAAATDAVIVFLFLRPFHDQFSLSKRWRIISLFFFLAAAFARIERKGKMVFLDAYAKAICLFAFEK